MKSKHTLILGIAVVIVVIIALVLYFGPLKTHAPVKPAQQSTATTTADGWNIYRDRDYQVTFNYPPDWQIFVGKAPGNVTVINAYKKSEVQKPPFTHQSDVTEVSLFPRGIPTEGLQGKPVQSNVTLQEPASSALDYQLADGKTFATLIDFLNVPENWEPYGFAFARLQIQNPEIYCMQNGVKVSQAACDSGVESGGGDVIYSGSVDAGDRAIEEKILGSITFTN